MGDLRAVHVGEAGQPPGTLGTFELRRIAWPTLRRGTSGRVTVSHAFALGAVGADELARTADALAEAIAAPPRRVLVLKDGRPVQGQPA